MKETTRQLILLIGILTLLTSGLVAFNISRTSGTTDQSPEPDTSQGQDVNTTETPKDDIPTTGENDTGNQTGNETSESQEDEPQGIIQQSIKGFQLMFRDMRTTMGAVSGDSGKTS